MDRRMSDAHPLSRLTEREKESLRRRLDHKSAKEIALELGVSHHAVEKRLKMARAKLDVGSSLQAARLLASHEGYQQGVAQAPDLPDRRPARHRTLRHLAIAGSIAMGIGLAVALISDLGSGGMYASLQAWDVTAAASPQPGEISVLYAPSFSELDRDHSGYLEGNEAPQLIRTDGHPSIARGADGRTEISGESVTITPAEDPATFIRQADTNGDARVSREEFDAWAKRTRLE